jgi:hypothetical protein
MQAITEDWLAVWLGFLSIALIVAGVRLDVPSFAWTGAADLLGTVFGAQNLMATLTVGIALGLLASVGIALMRGSVARFAVGFAATYAIAWVAQLIAGHRAIASWGVEYVIFALLLGLLISNAIGVPHWLR